MSTVYLQHLHVQNPSLDLEATSVCSYSPLCHKSTIVSALDAKCAYMEIHASHRFSLFWHMIHRPVLSQNVLICCPEQYRQAKPQYRCSVTHFGQLIWVPSTKSGL